MSARPHIAIGRLGAGIAAVAAMSASCATTTPASSQVDLSGAVVQGGAHADDPLAVYDAPALHAQAQAQLEAGHPVAAIERWRLLLRKFPMADEAPAAALQLGMALAGRGEPREALVVWERALDEYPKAKQVASMLVAMGVVYRELKQDEQALAAFADAIEHFPGTPYAIDAWLYTADIAMEAKNYDEAEFIYRRLLDDFGLYTPAIIEVKVRLGRALAASKRYDEARQILREALRLYDDHRASEYLPAGDAAEAQFVMGETYREQFDAAPLGGSREVMRERLETKASLLLAAQTHYTKAIRLGDLKWASAGGYRIGDLYESLHRAIVAVPIPPELTAAQAHLYRDELHARIRVLLTKAITVYERTLDMAERTGLGGDWVERTQTALDRLKQAYLDDLARLDHGPASPAAASQPAGDH